MNERGFSKKDETLVKLLMRTGMAKNVAKTLVFLNKKEETTSVEIEISTALETARSVDCNAGTAP